MLETSSQLQNRWKKRRIREKLLHVDPIRNYRDNLWKSPLRMLANPSLRAGNLAYLLSNSSIFWVVTSPPNFWTRSPFVDSKTHQLAPQSKPKQKSKSNRTVAESGPPPRRARLLTSRFCNSNFFSLLLQKDHLFLPNASLITLHIK